MPIDTTKTGAAIAAYRQRMNLSQQGLAGLMNVTHQAVSKWEKGMALPDTETLLALAKLFGTSMEDLLMGVLPKESIPAYEEATMQQESENTEPAEPLQTEALKDLDFSSVINMMPFVSTKVADRLFRAYSENCRPDAGKLVSLAPFVSTQALNDYLLSHPLSDYDPHILCGLAPFLPTGTVDALIMGLDKPIPPHAVQILIPFASAKVVDQMVIDKLGIQWDEGEAVSETENNFSAQQMQDRIHQKIRQKLDALDVNKIQQLINQKLDTLNQKENSYPHSADPASAYQENSEAASAAKRVSPRMRLICKADETDDSELIDVFCEIAGELDHIEQSALVKTLLTHQMYNKLADIIDELDEDVQHTLLDKAFEINDPELLHLISEHL